MHEPIKPINVSLSEAAEMLNLSVRSLNYLRSDKRLKTRKQGKRVLVPMSEVQRLAKTNIGAIRPTKQNGTGVVNG